MSQKVKVSGTWRDANPYVNVGGTWKLSDYVWNKQDGEWYTSFVKGGLVDRSWDDADASDPFYVGNGGLYVLSIAVQSDDKIVAGGGFTSWNGTTVGGIVRLNSNGTQDTAFTTNNGTGANSTILSIAVQSDDKIVAGGFFTSWNGTTVGRIVRLNSNGTLDTTFMANIGTGANSTVLSIAVQPDGKILVGGGFTAWNGTTVGRIVRLNSDGTLDTAFTTNIGGGAVYGSVKAIAVQSDGKIILGGNILFWDVFPSNQVGSIVRLNSNGTQDTAFTTNNGTGANGDLFSMAVQSDGKIIVGGQLTSWNGTTVGRIVRLNSNGTLDTAFTTNTGTGANSTPNAIAVQSDGKILVSGFFTSWNGTAVGYIVRLNSNGTRDTAFTTNNGAGPNNAISSITIQSDGQILLGGDFDTWDGVYTSSIVRLDSDGVRTLASSTFASSMYTGTVLSLTTQSDAKVLVGGYFAEWNYAPVNNIVRLNSNGTLDTTFMTNIGTAANSNIFSMAAQSDDKILIGGFFTTWNGTTVGRIVRLNSNGTLDTTFMTNIGTGGNSYTYTIAVQSDGKILVGGGFTAWNGTTVGYIVRLNSDGTLDTAFTTNNGTGANNVPNAIAVQPDGKILVGGGFTAWNGTTVGRIVRLNSNGTLDTAFTTNIGTGPNSTVRSIAVQSDGKIVLGGYFTTWNGTAVGYIVRLNSNGTLDTAFTTNNGIAANSNVISIAVQSDDKIVAGGFFTSWNGTTVGRIVRLNSNGTLDTAFTTNTGTGAIYGVGTVAVQPDGKILVGGEFITWNSVQHRRLIRIGGEIAA